MTGGKIKVRHGGAYLSFPLLRSRRITSAQEFKISLSKKARCHLKEKNPDHFGHVTFDMPIGHPPINVKNVVKYDSVKIGGQGCAKDIQHTDAT
jgi:hypothetical protein